MPGPETPKLAADAIIELIDLPEPPIVLIERKYPPYGWAIPGGFVDIQQDASIEDCARRKLREKTGVESPYLEQLATYGSQDRDPRPWTATTVYFALLAAETLKPDRGPDAVRWWSVRGEAVDTPLAFDHRHILADAVARLRNKLEYTHLFPFYLLTFNWYFFIQNEGFSGSFCLQGNGGLTLILSPV